MATTWTLWVLRSRQVRILPRRLGSILRKAHLDEGAKAGPFMWSFHVMLGDIRDHRGSMGEGCLSRVLHGLFWEQELSSSDKSRLQIGCSGAY